MATLAPAQTATSAPSSRTRRIQVKIVTLVLLGVALGFGYDWASSRLYRPGRVAGFHVGLVHGALMPAALPALLMGKDCPIYAVNNAGRFYNIGYILGINACGTVFFGCAFWPSRKR